MVFTTPSYIEKLPFQPPDSVPIHEFLFGEGDKYGRYPKASSKPPFTCGVTGKAYSAEEVAQRIDFIARSLSSELGLRVNEGSEMDKVIAVYTLNALDTLPVSWSAHRLSGVSTPISPSYSTSELTRQLKVTKAKAIFTCVPLLANALESAEAVGIPKERIFLIELPEKALKGASTPKGFKTVDDLVSQGKELDSIPKVEFSEGQGARQVAYLCSSSGTSGLPKNVKISHTNVIANVMQLTSYEANYKDKEPELSLGVLPLSHSYALIVTGHTGVYRGDGLVVLPGFDLHEVLRTIQEHKLGRLWMVPPMVVAMIKASSIAKKYDLTSVTTAVVGASNLTREVFQSFTNLFPSCSLVQGYGLTEAAVVVCFQNPHDIMFGSCGHIFPGYEARLISNEGEEVTEYNKPGELLLRSPSVMLGYLDNEEATKDTFTTDGWLRTGDLMEIRKSEGGNEHVFIVDRVKELIKVRGMQVAPTEVEAFLSKHPDIADVTVVPIPNEAAGELPIAFVVKSPDSKEKSEKALKEELHGYVNGELAEYKRLAGGIEFLDALPKSAAGKTQRGTMKQKAKAIYEASQMKPAAPPVVQSFEFDSDDDSDED